MGIFTKQTERYCSNLKLGKMKLSEAKRNYKRCKSLEGKRNAFNKAMLNLSHSDQQSFIAWQKQF